jgi:prepilin-type N-terminal cleavage/methylation domain-containing protein
MTRTRTIRGFTLLELLVAVTITLVIAGLMLAVTSNVLNLWRRDQASHTLATTARQVFDLLEQDFQSAIYRRDTNRWLAVDLLDSPDSLANHGWLLTAGLMKPASGGSLLPLPPVDAGNIGPLRSARFGLSGCWLRFIATNVESGGSLPTVIAYQMVRRPITGDPVPVNAAAIRYSLYRSAISNADTFAAGYDVTTSAYSSPGNNPYSASSTLYRAARNVMNPSHANLLASNVVDFGCWLYLRNPDGTLLRIFPSGAGDSSHHAIGNSTTSDTRYPEVVDVMIRILTENGATLLEAIEANRIPVRPPQYGTDAEWWWGVVEANSRVYTRRIEIKGVGL